MIFKQHSLALSFLFALVTIPIAVTFTNTDLQNEQQLEESIKITSISAKDLLKNVDHIKQKNIIFDFTGVLFKLDHMSVAGQMGLLKILFYTITHFKSASKLKKLLFEFLNAISDSEPREHATDGKEPLPNLMCQWLLGDISGESILKKMKHAMNNKYKTYFASSMERNLIYKAAEVTFNPEVMLKAMKPIQKTFTFIKKLHEKRDANGDRVHNIYGLTNMDRDTLHALLERYHKIFACFDGIVSSGDVGSIKPNPGIYYDLLNTYRLFPHDCLFFDDQRKNVEEALLLGFNALQFRA